MIIWYPFIYVIGVQSNRPDNSPRKFAALRSYNANDRTPKTSTDRLVRWIAFGHVSHGPVQWWIDWLIVSLICFEALMKAQIVSGMCSRTTVRVVARLFDSLGCIIFLLECRMQIVAVCKTRHLRLKRWRTQQKFCLDVIPIQFYNNFPL